MKNALKILLPGIIVAAISNCSGSQPVQKGRVYAGNMSYICAMHGVHRLEDRQDSSKCFNVDFSDPDEYYFVKESSSSGKNDLKMVSARLRGMVEGQITRMVISRIEKMTGREIFRNWSFDNMSIPAVIREFTANYGTGNSVVVVGIIRKKDLSGKAPITYLPLEYKMQLIGKEKSGKDGLLPVP
jgi:hypothetical protein